MPRSVQRWSSIKVFNIEHCGYNSTMPRRLEWIERPSFQGFGCSECSWTFNPSGPLTQGWFDQVKQKYKTERDKEFAVHVCIKRSKSPDRSAK